MENQNLKTTAKIAAITVLIGSVFMLVGAAIWGISGADIDQALSEKDMANYLILAHERKTMLITNLTLWICGVIVLGAAGFLMANLSNSKSILSKIIRYNYSIAIPIVVIAYTAWLSIVVRLTAHDPHETAELAEVVGWFASRADWIATILILATGPFLIAISGRNSWVPKWFRIWSYVCLFTGFLNLLAMFADGLTTYGFLIIPVGMGWMVASFFVLRRLSKSAI